MARTATTPSEEAACCPYEVHDASEASAGYPYLLFRPEPGGSESHVLLLVLHGVGARRNQPQGQSADIVDRMVRASSYRYTITGLLGNMHLPPEVSWLDEEYVKVGRFVRRHFVVVAPQTDAAPMHSAEDPHLQCRWGQPGRLQRLVDHVVSEQLCGTHISARAVLGFSMGGAGAWNAALSGAFQAAVSICGEGYDELHCTSVGGQTSMGTCNDQALNFPILQTALWAFHAANDTSDRPSAGTEPVVAEACATLRAWEEAAGRRRPADQLRYNWAAGKSDSWTYFDGVWDQEQKTLTVLQAADDLAAVVAAAPSGGATDAGGPGASSVQLTSTGPLRPLWGHFLWTVVSRDIEVFQWILKKAREGPLRPVEAVPLLPCQDRFCGLLPVGFPVVAAEDIWCSDEEGSRRGGAGASCGVARGAQGVVVAGAPGLPTLYEVEFRAGPGNEAVTCRGVPGSSLRSRLKHVADRAGESENFARRTPRPAAARAA